MLVLLASTEAPSETDMALCNCGIYKFPHREGSGHCIVGRYGPVCSECGNACRVNVGRERTRSEHFGQIEWTTVCYRESDCCGAMVLE